MKPGRPVATPVELATLHGLTWLVVGCSVGLLLATLLLVPRLGELLSPLTYGRWMPVHLNLLLYGWCALPLVALLFRIYLSGPDGTPLTPDRQATGYAGVSADLAEEHWFAFAWPEVLTEKQRRLIYVDEQGVVFGTELHDLLGRTGPLPGSDFFPGPNEPSTRDQPGQRTWHEIR